MNASVSEEGEKKTAICILAIPTYKTLFNIKCFIHLLKVIVVIGLFRPKESSRVNIKF